MKTTKKGFTLIELIVVIAIIGVLAAILVPTMLGYVRKSKISSANSAASSVFKAINSTLTELDEEGVDVGGDWTIEYDTTTNPSTPQWKTVSGFSVTEDIGSVVGSGNKFDKKIANFFSDIKKMKKGCKAGITGGACIACAVAPDSTYVGTYPGGVVTSDSFVTYKNNLAKGFNDAVIKAGYNCSSGSYTPSGT